MKTRDMKLDEIKVGERYREEMGDLSSLVESIKDKGLLQPISVDGKNNLLAGGRRLTASKEAGLKTIPVVVREVEGELDAREVELIENTMRKDFHWTERTRLERRIFDLRLEQDPEWTQKKQAELMEGSEGATSRRLQLADMLEVVPELGDSKTEKEAWKKYKQLEEDVVTQTLISTDDSRWKDVAKHAEKHYQIGDAIEGLKKAYKNDLHFIEVDPPYAVELDKRKSRNQDLIQMDAYNEVDAKEYPAFVEAVAKECFTCLKKDTFMVWWFGPTWYKEVREILKKVGFSVSDIPAIWVKDHAGQTASPDTMLGNAYEPFFICRKGKPKLRTPGRNNTFVFRPVAPQNKIHPTERPIELMLEILDTFVYPGSKICVPFLGSGVTVRACYQRDVLGFGWDIDKMTKTRFVNAVYKDKTGGSSE